MYGHKRCTFWDSANVFRDGWMKRTDTNERTGRRVSQNIYEDSVIMVPLLLSGIQTNFNQSLLTVYCSIQFVKVAVEGKVQKKPS